MEEKRQTTETTKTAYVTINNLVGAPAHIMVKYAQNCEDNFQRVRKEQELCQNCRGEKCLQPVPEMVHMITGYRGYPYFPLIGCPLQKIRKRRNLYEARKAKAGIPSIYQGKIFADYRETDGNHGAVQIAQNMVRGKNVEKGLYLYGARGTGKSLLAAIVGNLFLQQGRDVIFAGPSQLRYQFREIFKNPDQLHLELETCDLLILDNLGDERFNSWGLEQLSRIVNSRYQDKKLTIVTSNYGLKALEAKMAQIVGTPDSHDQDTAARICSRLSYMMLPVPFYGMDRCKLEAGGQGYGRTTTKNFPPQPIELFANA
ncbi:ATP-binding protein [uncultured Acidaminococcus sp.]|uniref:ATP-binding protein n=1 Tax=uncultured Acidaminococcus sp. TaxID=352152 RepID=UPI0026602738|nr:ATP-binding protein [uncultured Acidaminococcus sp.]